MAAKKRTAVKFHAEIYSEPAVKTAAKEYADFASFKISRKGRYIIVVIDPAGGRQPAELADEFVNCVLFNSR